MPVGYRGPQVSDALGDASLGRIAPTPPVINGGGVGHVSPCLAGDRERVLTAASDDDEGVTFGDDVESRREHAR
jgi:hypothetical protein